MNVQVFGPKKSSLSPPPAAESGIRQHRDPLGLWIVLAGLSISLHLAGLWAVREWGHSVPEASEGSQPIPIAMVELDTEAIAPTDSPDPTLQTEAATQAPERAIAPTRPTPNPPAPSTDRVPSSPPSSISPAPSSSSPSEASPTPPPDSPADESPTAQPSSPPSSESSTPQTTPPAERPQVDDGLDMPELPPIPNVSETERNPGATSASESNLPSIAVNPNPSPAQFSVKIEAAPTPLAAVDTAEPSVDSLPQPIPAEKTITLDPVQWVCTMTPDSESELGTPVAIRVGVDAAGRVSQAQLGWVDSSSANRSGATFSEIPPEAATEYQVFAQCLIEQWDFAPAMRDGLEVASNQLLVYVTVTALN